MSAPKFGANIGNLKNASCNDRDIRDNRYKLKNPELQATDMPRGETRMSDARALLNNVLKDIESWPDLTDLTQADRKMHDDKISILRESVDIFLKYTKNSGDIERAMLAFAGAIYSAHSIGTFKAPALPPPRPGEGKSIIDVLLQPTTKRPTAEFVSTLQAFDPDFRAKLMEIRAEKMRASKAARHSGREQALMAAIHAEMESTACKRSYKEATAIREAVNRRLSAEGYEPVSVDVIARRIKKIPRT